MVCASVSTLHGPASDDHFSRPDRHIPHLHNAALGRYDPSELPQVGDQFHPRDTRHRLEVLDQVGLAHVELDQARR